MAFDDGTFCDNHDPEEVKYEQGAELAINTEVQLTYHLTAGQSSAGTRKLKNYISRFV